MRIPALVVFVAGALAACSDAANSATSDQENQLYASRALRWSNRSIPVCFEDASPETATERGWVKDAVLTSWRAVSAVDFVGWGACTENARGLHVAVADAGPHTDSLGTHLDGVTNGITLDFAFSNWSVGCQQTREFCIRAGAVHEFGHALGFAHEQNRPDTPEWCVSEGLDQGAKGDLAIGPWDVDSIMNYCNPKWTGDGHLSAMDILAVQGVYGRPAGDWVVAPANGTTFGDERLATIGNGAGAQSLMLADVDGDGRADAVAYFDQQGRWWTAKSNGTGFDAYVLSREGHGGSGARALIGDVDGDGRADAVAMYPSKGTWWIALSTGTSFGADSLALSGFGAGASDVFLADVDGDGRADAITLDRKSGDWWVARSNGAGFLPGVRFAHAHGGGCTDAFVADVDGDHRADAVTFFADDGSWWVSPSTGSAFGTSTSWRSGHGIASTARLLGDVDGDGRADAVVFVRGGGDWWIARSNGNAFDADVHARSNFGLTIDDGMVLPLLGDTDGDHRADAVLVWQ